MINHKALLEKCPVVIKITLLREGLLRYIMRIKSKVQVSYSMIVLGMNFYSNMYMLIIYDIVVIIY